MWFRVYYGDECVYICIWNVCSQHIILLLTISIDNSIISVHYNMCIYYIYMYVFKAVVNHIYVDWIFWLQEVFDSWPSRWRYRFTSSPPLLDAPWRETRAVRSVYVIKGTRVSRRRPANKRTAYTARFLYIYIHTRGAVAIERATDLGRGKKEEATGSLVWFFIYLLYYYFYFFFYFYDFADDDDGDDDD